MFHKFKTTTYATLLLIGVFVLPYAGNVADVNAEDYNCRGTKKEVRQCLKAVITVRDEMIDQMDAGRERMETENQRLLVVEDEMRDDKKKHAECIHRLLIQMEELLVEYDNHKSEFINSVTKLRYCWENPSSRH